MSFVSCTNHSYALCRKTTSIDPGPPGCRTSGYESARSAAETAALHHQKRNSEKASRAKTGSQFHKEVPIKHKVQTQVPFLFGEVRRFFELFLGGGGFFGRFFGAVRPVGWAPVSLDRPGPRPGSCRGSCQPQAAAGGKPKQRPAILFRPRVGQKFWPQAQASNALSRNPWGGCGFLLNLLVQPQFSGFLPEPRCFRDPANGDALARVSC